MTTEPGDERQRLFLALWPDGETRARLAALTRRLKPHVQGRATPAAKLHLTLAFLGAVAPQQHRRLCQRLNRLPFTPFTLQLDHLGYWPRPQVVWLGRCRPPHPLADWIEALRQTLRELALPVEQRPFVPHVTLLRKVHHRPPPLEIDPIPWAVHDFVLVESHLTPRGADYRILQRWPKDTP